MANIELPYVQRFTDRHGKVRHYFRKPGCKRVALPPPGSPGFMEAYEAANLTPYQAGKRAPAGSVAAIISAYYQSDAFTSLKPQTQANYRNILDRFRAEYGELPAKRLEARHLKAILEKRVAAKPGATANLLKRLKGVFGYAAEAGLMQNDPTLGVKLKTRKTDGFRAWTDADIEKFREHWPEGSRARLALNLLLYTGQRRSDVVLMGRQHVRGDTLHVRQKKTGAELQIPIHPVLKAQLDKLSKSSLTFLMTAYDKPMSEAGFTQWFVECAQAAGLPPRSGPHGLRKAAGRMLAEAGCSVREIASITGHESLKEVERYTKSADQARLARAAMGRIANR